jgi:acyl-CoA synthetase (AMP-forming)/AMP-acid ligase II
MVQTLRDVVRRWADETPEQAAIVDAGNSLTYAELDEISSRIANLVLARAVDSPHVGYLGQNSLAFWPIWLGATKAGRGLCPLNWRSNPTEICEVVRDACIKLLFVCDDRTDLAADIRSRLGGDVDIVSCGDDFLRHLEPWSAADPDLPLLGSQTALLTYTSGTTGLPKGVQIRHCAIAAWFEMSALEPAETWAPDDVMLQVMPNFHLAGSFVPLPALLHGATIAVLPSFEPSSFIEAIGRFRATVTCLVPTAIQMVIGSHLPEGADWSSLRRVLYAGSPIARDVLAKANEVLACDLVQFYGTTEAGLVTLLRPADHDAALGDRLTSCGQPLPRVEIRIVDESGRDVPRNAVGELWVRSPMAFESYWRRPEETRDAFVDGWYRTGDLGRCDNDGYYFLVDRLKDLIVTGGENVYSVEVERALYSHPDIDSAAVVGEPDEKWGERIVAYVVVRRGAEVTVEGLTAHCRGVLASYKVPKRIVIRSSLPMTPNGKIQKTSLRKAEA